MGELYFFLLGLASGMVLLAMSAYRRVTPSWLRWLLMGSGLLVIGRYIALALFASTESPQQVWIFRHLWFGSAIGLMVPSVFAVDQLVRHPAMTPKKLLAWVAPFLVADGAIMTVGDFRAGPDPIIGWTLHLSSPWRMVAVGTETVFAIGFIGMCILLMRKLPVRPIRLALAGLVLGSLYLALDGLLAALGRWYFRPFLFSEMVMCLAIWYAYERAADSR